MNIAEDIQLLIIEDNHDDFELTVRHLKNAGFKLESKRVDNDKDLRDALAVNRWDIVLSDNSMPGFNANAALKITKEMEPLIPFVIYSGTINEELATEAMKIGASNYVVKGNFNRLISVLDEELKEYNLRKELAQSKSELLESESRLSEIIESIDDVLIVTDKKGNCKYLNHQACQLIGKNYASVKNLPIESLFKDFDDQELVHKISKNIKSNTPTYFNHLYKKDGSNYFYSVGIQPTDNVFSILFRNITETYKVNSSLKKSHDDLKTILYKMGHDLKSPVASSLGLLNLIKYDESNYADYLDKLESSVLSLDKIITDLSSIGKLKDPTFSVATESLVDEVYKITSWLSLNPEYTKAILKVEHDRNLLLKTNWSVFRSVLQNLIENAYKYSSKAVQPEVSVVISQTLSHLEITVIDNGIGVKEEYLDRIFDLFFRANNIAKGSGLGLYLVKEGVERLNGELQVSSKYGEGSQFKVTIPIKSSDENVVVSNI